MQCFCNSWRVRNLLWMVLRLNNSLRLAENIVSFHARQLRPSINDRPWIQWILHSSCVVENAREDPFPLPWIFMPMEVHLRQLATWTYQITPCWTPSSCMQEESDHSQRPPTQLTRTVMWIHRYQWLSRRLGRILLSRIWWTHCRLGVSTTATSSVTDGNIPWRQHSAEWLHCWAMGMWRLGLPWEKPTEQSLLPVHNTWSVQIYPVWHQEEGSVDVIWQRAEGRKHLSEFPKHPKQGWRPGARG